MCIFFIVWGRWNICELIILFLWWNVGIGIDCFINGWRKYFGCRSWKWLLCIGFVRDGKRGMCYWYFFLFCRSNGKKRGKECLLDEFFWFVFFRNIWYNFYVDEWIGYYWEVGKYGSFFLKDEIIVLFWGMYFDGF